MIYRGDHLEVYFCEIFTSFMMSEKKNVLKRLNTYKNDLILTRFFPMFY